jgi:hypothetical protein
VSAATIPSPWFPGCVCAYDLLLGTVFLWHVTKFLKWTVRCQGGRRVTREQAYREKHRDTRWQEIPVDRLRQCPGLFQHVLVDLPNVLPSHGLSSSGLVVSAATRYVYVSSLRLSHQ